jgi:hypothetical protein
MALVFYLEERSMLTPVEAWVALGASGCAALGGIFSALSRRKDIADAVVFLGAVGALGGYAGYHLLTPEGRAASIVKRNCEATAPKDQKAALVLQPDGTYKCTYKPD